MKVVQPLRPVGMVQNLASSLTEKAAGFGLSLAVDRQSLDELARPFPTAASIDVQRAIAAVFIRSDYQALPKPEIVGVLRQSRLKSRSGDDVVDILIRGLRAP